MRRFGDLIAGPLDRSMQIFQRDLVFIKTNRRLCVFERGICRLYAFNSRQGNSHFIGAFRVSQTRQFQHSNLHFLSL